MIEIITDYNKGFRWFKNENIFVKGYLFDQNEEYYENNKLLNYFKNVNNIADFKKSLNKANGVFSVIIKTNQNKILAAVDKTRFFPLFYSFRNGNLLISDNIYVHKKNTKVEFNYASMECLKSCGYVLENKTFLKNVYQIQAGEFLVLSANKIQQKSFFFDYSIKNVKKEEFDALVYKGKYYLEKAFERLIKSLNGKPVVIPLSSGYDSRLIAVMFKKHNYKNLTCITYGRKGNAELEKSKKTAEKLGFKWIFVEYDKSFDQNFYKKDIFKRYMTYTGQGVSMPFLQEYIAGLHLKNNNLIPENSVFIPGHVGDNIGGSLYRKFLNENVSLKSIPRKMLKTNIFFLDLPPKYKKRIKKILKKQIITAQNSKKIPFSVFENWFYKERLAKYIFNSSHMFTFLNYQIRFPYWDDNLVRFFKYLPYEYKVFKRLYNYILKTEFFQKYKVDFDEGFSSPTSNVFAKRIKHQIKRIIPNSIIRKKLKSQDWQFAYEHTKSFEKYFVKKNIKYNKRIRKFVGLITQWYVCFFEKYFDKYNNDL